MHNWISAELWQYIARWRTARCDHLNGLEKNELVLFWLTFEEKKRELIFDRYFEKWKGSIFDFWKIVYGVLNSCGKSDQLSANMKFANSRWAKRKISQFMILTNLLVIVFENSFLSSINYRVHFLRASITEITEKANSEWSNGRSKSYTKSIPLEH